MCLGGDVANQDGCPDSYPAVLVCRSPCPHIELCRGPSVKSPLCRADRGLSICRPAWDNSAPADWGRFVSEISGEGNNGEEFGVWRIGFEGVCP
jgi:hypothetical protein